MTTLVALAFLIAQPSNPSQASVFEIPSSKTQHSIDLPTGKMSYTATAGQVALRNDQGEIECRMFNVAYTKEGANRPVMFLFNGGPGSATMWLHMGGLAPMRAPMLDDGSLPKPPYEAVPSAENWLSFSDLVFVDAPNTGFSRISKPDLATKYFGVRPDIAAFTVFIKNWLTENKRWNSPIFIAGESYGGIRGSGLVKSLFDAGVAVNGFISISGTSNYITLDSLRGNDANFIGFFPSLAATAWYHKKLSPRFKTVEQLVAEVTKWVDEEYGPALQKGNSLSVEKREQIAGKMAEYLGISKKYCFGSNLRISEFSFFRELLRDDSLTVGRLDSRLTVKEESQQGNSRQNDPASDAMTAPYYSAFRDYVDKKLGVKTNLDYFIYGNVSPWTEPQGTFPETSTDLRNLIAANPHFKVLYACGYYDLACPFHASMYTVNHMRLDPEQRKRVSFTYYPAGHMMYIEKGSRAKLRDDVQAFVASCLN